MRLHTFFIWEGPDVKDKELLKKAFELIFLKLVLPGTLYDWHFCHCYESDLYATVTELSQDGMYIAVPIVST